MECLIVDKDLAERTIAAPAQLDLVTRDDFQRAAIGLVEEMPDGPGVVILDLSETHCLDASALGALAVIQARAADRHLVVRLKNASEDVRYSLMLARLENRFEFIDLE
jgi:anti-anti-sigma regulatory factor